MDLKWDITVAVDATDIKWKTKGAVGAIVIMVTVL